MNGQFIWTMLFNQCGTCFPKGNQKSSTIKFSPIYTNILNRNKENEHSEKQNYFKRHLTGFKEKETLKYNKVQLH